MSDDEDDDEDEEKPNIQLLSDQEDDAMDSFDPSYEPEDIVLPVSSAHSSLPSGVVRNKHRKHGGPKVLQRRVKHKSGRARDWFPLKSFIDFCNENDDDAASTNWNWRSFIEFSGVS
jgi:nucleoside-specific outer membrane channel protein Tsx